jgi:hypothetical protein
MRRLPGVRTLGLFRYPTPDDWDGKLCHDVLKSAVTSFSPGPIRSNSGFPTITMMNKEYKMTEGDSGWRYCC